MDEDIAIINQNTRVSLIKKFFKENSKKIFFLILIIVTLLLIFFAFEEFKKRKKANLAEIYNSLIFNTDKFANEEIKNKMIEIVNGRVDTYSTLALYYLIDNQLIKDQDKINELFDTVISINKDEELKNLVIFKKGLYFSDKLQETELLEILNPIINSESMEIWYCAMILTTIGELPCSLITRLLERPSRVLVTFSGGRYTSSSILLRGR